MGEEESESESSTAATAVPRSSLSLRFLGLLKQPAADSDLDPNLSSFSPSSLELDESDVVWSSDNSSPCSLSSPLPTSPLALRRTPRAFVPAAFGLSALLESGTDAGPGPGPLRRQSSPITPPVAVPIARPSLSPRKAFNQSAPMAVPVWPGKTREGRNGRVHGVWGLEVEEEDMGRIEEDDMEEMVPPHVIVARSHMTSFSVLEGAGRTLKGRDLRRVRNAVLQKTGFLDV